ncbi:halovibrin HvnA [Pseudomonas sp. SAICEU22]|uniref:Halovibrin HvnA n=1 Tax=Pseudomonas agronomica TaxID=2979328 RepID=A0ABT3F4G8_9PSED|nr:halovibrin HvnA [Pseudomonas agronomica]MCW1243990.1 halovibrin HvnA [Pseudomonas agronomica]
MKKIMFMVLGFVLLLGCTTPELISRNLPLLSSRSGEQVAQDLTARYADTRSHCDDVEEVAHRCTGVIFRGTSFSPQYHSWNPNPASAEPKNGVSFSYLRADSNFRSLAYNYVNGFIFYPENNRPAGKDRMVVRCFFPVDAGSDVRKPDGCGPTTHAGSYDSRPCQVLGITTGQQWLAHFLAIPVAAPRGFFQCGFDVRAIRGKDAAKAFVQAIDAMRRAGEESFRIQNELIITPWPQNAGATLPIEAFFYTLEHAGGLTSAQADQRDLFNTDGIVRPIILMTLPTAATGRATFQFRQADQALSLTAY